MVGLGCCTKFKDIQNVIIRKTKVTLSYYILYELRFCNVHLLSVNLQNS